MNIQGPKNGRFPKGTSGNPSGRPKGSRNQATLFIQEMLAGEAEPIGRKLIELAKQGDRLALRLCVDRLSPVRREAPIEFEMPPIHAPEDLLPAYQAVTNAACQGRITLSDASALADILDRQARTFKLLGPESEDTLVDLIGRPDGA